MKKKIKFFISILLKVFVVFFVLNIIKSAMFILLDLIVKGYINYLKKGNLKEKWMVIDVITRFVPVFIIILWYFVKKGKTISLYVVISSSIIYEIFISSFSVFNLTENMRINNFIFIFIMFLMAFICSILIKAITTVPPATQLHKVSRL